jgi:hypothetical protein
MPSAAMRNLPVMLVSFDEGRTAVLSRRVGWLDANDPPREVSTL